jgi:hypothetical protein
MCNIATKLVAGRLKMLEDGALKGFTRKRNVVDQMRETFIHEANRQRDKAVSDTLHNPPPANIYLAFFLSCRHAFPLYFSTISGAGRPDSPHVQTVFALLTIHTHISMTLL